MAHDPEGRGRVGVVIDHGHFHVDILVILVIRRAPDEPILLVDDHLQSFADILDCAVCIRTGAPAG